MPNRWRFAWAWTIGATLLLAACPGIKLPPDLVPKPPKPTPKPTPAPTPTPDPSPICAPPGLVTACWHMPPGHGWEFIPPVLEPPVTPKPEPTPEPTPPPSTNESDCDGEPGPLTGTREGTNGNAVNQVMRDLTGCAIGSRCPLASKRHSQAWLREVVLVLRARGLCAGQHEPGHTDEIAVSKDRRSRREGYHVFGGFDGKGPVPAGRPPRLVVWAPGAVRQTYAAPPVGPAPAPPVPPPPAPPSGACPAAPCPAREWTRETLPDGWDSALIGKPAYHINSRTYVGADRDTTPKITRNEAYCVSIGYDHPPIAECPVRPDGHPEREAVERWLLYGGFARQGRKGETAETCAPKHDNPAMFHEGTSNCRVCNARPDGDPLQVCTPWF